MILKLGKTNGLVLINKRIKLVTTIQSSNYLLTKQNLKLLKMIKI